MKAARKQPLSEYDIPDPVFDNAEKVPGVKFPDLARASVRRSAFYYVNTDKHPLDIKNLAQIIQAIVDNCEAAARAMKVLDDAPFEFVTLPPDPDLRLRLEAKVALARGTLRETWFHRRGPRPNRARMAFIHNVAVNYRHAGGQLKITRRSDHTKGSKVSYGPFFNFYRDVLNCLPEQFQMDDEALATALKRLLKKDPWSP